MSYHHTEEMSALGRQIILAAIKAAKHNMDGIDPYPSADELDQIKSEYADVPHLLASYGETDPAKCQSAIDELFGVADNIDQKNSMTLNPGSTNSDRRFSGPLPKHAGGWADSISIAERKDDINSYLASWSGEARTQFDTFFVNHIDTAYPLQAALARSLALILQAHQEIRARANADVWEIGQKTLQALRLQMAFCGCTPSTVTATVTVGTAAAAVLTAGGAMSAALAVFSVANAITNAGVTASKIDKPKISDGTPLAILANMRAAITKIEQTINEQVSNLTTLTGTLAENVRRVGHRIDIPSPNDAPGFKAAIQNPNNPRGFRPTSS